VGVENGSPVILALSGELDVLRKDELRRRFAALAGARAAIVDLTAVSYLDSMALAEFVRTAKQFGARGARIVWVVPPGSNARRIFALAGLDRYFELAHDLAGARQALSTG
jgi:anti-anti-sigma factor